jgi:hypothetical protein
VKCECVVWCLLCLTGRTKLNGNESYSLVIKAAGLGTDHISPFNGEVWNGRSATSNSHYLFMRFCFIKHSTNLSSPAPTRLHGVTFRKTAVLIFSVVRTSVAMPTVRVSRILLVRHVVIYICYKGLRNIVKTMSG